MTSKVRETIANNRLIVNRLKSKYGFEKNDFELEDEKKKNTGMKIVLTDMDKKKGDETVKSAMIEEGIKNIDVSFIRESGLSDKEVNEKKNDFVLPEGKEVEKISSKIVDRFNDESIDIYENKNVVDSIDEQKYRKLLKEILILPWWKRFGYLNRLIISNI